VNRKTIKAEIEQPTGSDTKQLIEPEVETGNGEKKKDFEFLLNW